MKLFMTSALVSLSLNAGSMLLAAPNANPATTSQELKVKLYEMLGKETAVVNFAEGSSAISETERLNLSAVVSAVRVNSTISKAIVASWADKNYPTAKGQRLSKAERRLADARNESIKTALTNIGVQTIDSHTMAEQPNWISKVFNSEDSMIKGEGKITDPNDLFSAQVGNLLRERGGPGKSVVIIRRAGDQSIN
ncbi:MAG: hypothetical protein NT027_03165 [Proteobacteria bacterium]|nr:hypothetical protein [Pseudomonadota bacterium]